jgi:hypothetical protein
MTNMNGYTDETFWIAWSAVDMRIKLLSSAQRATVLGQLLQGSTYVYLSISISVRSEITIKTSTAIPVTVGLPTLHSLVLIRDSISCVCLQFRRQSPTAQPHKQKLTTLSIDQAR